MTDLVAAVPPHEPAEDALAFTGKLALSAIPVVGPLAVETIAHALDSRQSRRQHDFNVSIARTLTSALERIDAAVSLEDVIGSDEFIAAITRAQRVAAETASESKRRRLAAAVVNGGSWAPFTASEREQFTRLVDDFTDLHVWLLHYFVDPKGWLDARGLSSSYEGIYAGSVQGPLGAALGASEEGWLDAVRQVSGDLDRAALGSIPLSGMMTQGGTVQPRTSEKGRRFLAFLNEPSSLDVEPPASL